MPVADILIENARVITMNTAQPRAEAVAIAGKTILAVGSRDTVAACAGPNTRRIDAQGSTVLPGLIEAHLHLFLGAYALQLLQLTGLRGPEALARALRAYADAHPNEGLLICKAADYTLFGEGIPITRQRIDAALAERPVILVAGDHHTAWANTIALERAGLLHGREMPLGHEVVMGPDCTATGELREHAAYGPVLALRTSGGREDLGFPGLEPGPDLTAAERNTDLEVMKRGLAHCASYGFTSLHNMDGNLYQLELLAALEHQGDLICRTEIPFHLTPDKPVESLDIADQMRAQYASDRLRSGRVKLFMDGVIDSGTALLLEAYGDQPGWRGEALHSAQRFNDIAVEADRRGLQISVHAIGDGAVRRVLDGYETARRINGPRDSRHRIEHIELHHPTDLARFRELGVIASMQPSHLPGAMDFPVEPWRSKVGTARLPHAFPLAALRNAGVPIAFASDWPVTDIDPMRSVKAAMVSAKLSPDCPDNSCTLDQALRSYTVEGAYAGFDENRLGQIMPGLLADVVVMDADLEGLPPSEIDTTRAAITLCDGRIIWEA